MFLRRSILPARLSTQGGQFRAPVTRLAPRHPKSKVPRLSSSWLARRDPFGSTASRGDPGRVRPTDATHIVKDEHPCTRQPAALIPAKPVVPPSPAFQRRRAHFCQRTRCRTECSRLRAVSLGLGSDASSPTGRRRALERADSDPDDLDRFRHRTIEERWTPWSETPSTGWQLLASSRRSRRAPSARAFRPPAPFHPSRFASG